MYQTVFTLATVRKFAVTVFLIGLLINLYGQKENNNVKRVSVPIMEYPEGEYTVELNKIRKTSPAYSFKTPYFTTVQVNVDENGDNILGDAANEPSIAFDPTNPDRMVIGWRQFDNVNNSFRQAGFGYTSDGGETWTFTGSINPGIFRSDPVLDSDAEGNFFYNSLTVQNDDYWCDVYKSENGGQSWDNGTFAQGGDKQWMSIDKTGGPGSGNIYHFWSTASICDPDFFTRSANSGASFEDCISIPGGPYWGTTAVGPEGELYVCGKRWNDFMLAKSSNAQFGGEEITWDFNYSVVELDGDIVGFGGYNCPNPNGLLGQTIIAVDSSGGPTHGNVYILCSVERYSINDPLDVMFTRSEDGGLNWSSPVRVNDDFTNNTYQWFGTMSVAPDGRIDVVWLDTRENPGQLYSVLYYAYSHDAGNTWSENLPLSESFDPHIGWPQQDKMGDYFDMVSNETGVHLAWANTFNGEEDVYYGRIYPEFTGAYEVSANNSVSSLQNYPNPFMGKTYIRYYLSEKYPVKIHVHDVSGRLIAQLVNQTQNEGFHNTVFDATGLQAGVYFYTLQAGLYSETKKLTVIE
ncbi:MAG: T9SS type A sorting domain-containing protein [Bacteroidales bacterium]|nr:T9SS type A sorting domain-containing protein [Bacteroidales bacterium]MCF8403786.1 T9SS type A sorting domain-containing protein [Bacteroidales bacterium]